MSKAIGMYYALFKLYCWFVEDWVIMFYGSKKLEKIKEGAKEKYKNKDLPDWERGWMKARLDIVNKNIEKKNKKKN